MKATMYDLSSLIQDLTALVERTADEKERLSG